MRLQDFLVRQTQKALMDLVRAVEALPSDRLDWSPGDGMRSAQSMMQEVAVSPDFHILVLDGGELSPSFHGDLMARAAGMTTFSECRREAEESTMRLCSVILGFDDGLLDDEVVLPFGPGVTMTMADVLGQHYWNMVYHLGQVNYIQTALGDNAMH
ncbi:MAG: DinB family protein [Fimbriimonadaceae bacterium]